MKYVLDSSVAIKWRLPENQSDNALRIKDAYVARIHELLAPDVFPIEVAHALARAERKGILIPPEGADALNDILLLAPRLVSYLPLLPRAYQIASAARIGVYDCLYVALAERENLPLITADQRLLTLKGYPLADLANF